MKIGKIIAVASIGLLAVPTLSMAAADETVQEQITRLQQEIAQLNQTSGGGAAPSAPSVPPIHEAVPARSARITFEQAAAMLAAGQSVPGTVTKVVVTKKGLIFKDTIEDIVTISGKIITITPAKPFIDSFDCPWAGRCESLSSNSLQFDALSGIYWLPKARFNYEYSGMGAGLPRGTLEATTICGTPLPGNHVKSLSVDGFCANTLRRAIHILASSGLSTLPTTPMEESQRP